MTSAWAVVTAGLTSPVTPTASSASRSGPRALCCYVFARDPAAIPGVPLSPSQHLSVTPVRGHSCWEITRGMEASTSPRCGHGISQTCWGPETSGHLVAAIHPRHHSKPRQSSPKRQALPPPWWHMAKAASITARVTWLSWQSPRHDGGLAQGEPPEPTKELPPGTWVGG